MCGSDTFYIGLSSLRHFFLVPCIMLQTSIKSCFYLVLYKFWDQFAHFLMWFRSTCSGGMNGYICLCAGDPCPPIFKSPIGGMEDIVDNQVMWDKSSYSVVRSLVIPYCFNVHVCGFMQMRNIQTPRLSQTYFTTTSRGEISSEGKICNFPSHFGWSLLLLLCVASVFMLGICILAV